MDEAPLSPEASLDLIDQEQQAAHRNLDVDPAVFLVPWGLAWLVAYGVLFLRFGTQFHVYLPDPQFRLLMSALPVFITGILYMSGGAIWRDRRQFTFGIWLSLINAAGLLAGPGWHSLIVSLLGGGGMLATAALQRAHRP